MYARAREIIRPGINELDVFNELQAVAVREFGEMLTGTGNDYACGVPGGPPRDRAAQDGELYILDLGPAFRGYFADNCRAIAVNGRPTDRLEDGPVMISSEGGGDGEPIDATGVRDIILAHLFEDT